MDPTLEVTNKDVVTYQDMPDVGDDPTPTSKDSLLPFSCNYMWQHNQHPVHCPVLQLLFFSSFCPLFFWPRDSFSWLIDIPNSRSSHALMICMSDL